MKGREVKAMYTDGDSEGTEIIIIKKVEKKNFSEELSINLRT